MKEGDRNRCVDLIGYTPWGCMILCRLPTGEMHKRYGFIYVDYQDDGHRRELVLKKDSIDWYKQVIAFQRGRSWR
ncbi:family 1 glycosylhydrolase [Dubosiella newyorkensis]|uniref:family 1 glycosylhydrolase n=1 Tax=Dubosiella newyorkensis TaxID=1862672 RepID=UPI003F66BB20